MKALAPAPGPVDRTMIRSEGAAWLTIIAVELAFVVLTRVVLTRYWTFSLDAELIRTPLRLLAVLIYWWLLRGHIGSRPVDRGRLLRPSFLLPALLWLSVPLLVGDASTMTATTKIVYALTSVVVGLKEEIAFRALIQGLLARRFGDAAAIVLATALFTAYHIGSIPPGLFAYAQVVIAGLVFGIVYARTGSLWLVVGMHTLYDALWSATPVLTPPFPYSVGLALLAAALAGIAWWGRAGIWADTARPAYATRR